MSLISIKYYVLCIMGILLLYIIHTTNYILPVAYAQALPSSGQAPIPTTVSPTSPVYTDLLVHNLFHTFSCLSVGASVIGQPCLSYRITQNAQGAIKSVPVLSQVNTGGGALGGIASIVDQLYLNPPVRTADYLASVGQGFGFAKEAKAQVVGSAQEVLNPIVKLWEVSRNISYVFMIIIFVVIGLMVMFRNRINPQTVITAQAALPGLVIGLILIFFSYFLSALLSDSAFLGVNLVGYYFSAVRGDPSPQDLLKDLSGFNVLSIFTNFVGIINVGNAEAAVGMIWSQLDLWVKTQLQAIASLVAAQFVLPFGSLFGGRGQLIATGISTTFTALSPTGEVGWLISLMAMVILIYSMLRLLLRLIKSYLSIIFLTITAPFQFLAAALPGRQGIATSWILNMLANALAFPAVLAVLYFVAFLLNKPFGPLVVSNPGTLPGNNIVPAVLAAAPSTAQIIGSSAFPLFGGIDLDFVRILLAFGALVAMPAVPDIIARTIGRVTAAGQLLGEEYSKGVAGGRGYYNQASGVGGGLAGQAGRLTTEKGLIYDPGKGIGGGDYRQPDSGTEHAFVSKAGQFAKFKQSPGAQWISAKYNKLRGK